VAEPYENQLSASGGPGLSGASPEAFGAAVGRGLEQAGESADRFIHQRREIDRDRQAAAAGVELATISTDLDTAAIDARNNAGPGGEGHSEAIGKAIDDRAGEALAKIKDPHIRDAFAGRYANLRDQIYTREYAWEAGARTEKFVTDFDNAGTQYANAQASNPNVSSLAAAIGDIETAGNALAVPADAKAKAIKEQQRKVVVAWANGMQDKDPRALIQVLDKGNLNPYFEPEDIKVLRSGADVEIRRDEAEARQQLAIQTADARERIGLIGKRIAAGDFSVSDQEFAAAAATPRNTISKGRASISPIGATSATLHVKHAPSRRRNGNSRSTRSRRRATSAARQRISASSICRSSAALPRAASIMIRSALQRPPGTRRRRSIGAIRRPIRSSIAPPGRGRGRARAGWSTRLICRPTRSRSFRIG
jgi:hypothetical protein